MRLHTLALVAAFNSFGVCVEAQTCGVLCNEDIWQSASLAEVAVEISRADLDARDDVYGWTPLMWAVNSYAKTETIQLLLNAGADVNAVNDGGWTALIMALWFPRDSDIDTIRVLLDAGADVNARASNGWTPLIYAVSWGTPEMVELLLGAGADASPMTSDGETAWDIAQQGPRKITGTDAYRLLQEASIKQMTLDDALAEALGVPDAQAADTPSPQPVGPLTTSEIDGFRSAVSQCYSIGALSSAAERVTVVISAEMTEDGKPVSTSLRLLDASGGEGKAVTEAYEVARRAILRCGISGYDLPQEKYAQWRKIEITFNPEQMRIK